MNAEAAELRWSIRTSFRSYVLGVGGETDVEDPAVDDGTEFRFPFDAEASSDSELGYRGSVRITAHEGLLNVLIADPRIHVGPEGLRLTVAAVDGTRLALAGLQPSEPQIADGLVRWAELPARLTPEGVAVFDFNYPAGAELSAVTFAVPESAATQLTRLL